MRPDAEWASLISAYCGAIGEAARNTAYNNLVTFLRQNPTFVQNTTRMGIEVQRALAAGAATGAAAAASRIPFQVYLQNVIRTFGGGPKGPPPLMIACVVGAIVITTSQAQAATAERQNAVPAYEEYVVWYTEKMVKAKQYHPQNTFPAPKTFDEWYAENR